MYVMVCKIREIPVLVCILGPQQNNKGFFRAFTHYWVNAGLFKLANPVAHFWV